MLLEIPRMKRQEMAIDPFQIIDKKVRKQLTRRSDVIGLAYYFGHFSTIGCTGVLVYFAYGTLFMLPAMLVHASRSHACSRRCMNAVTEPIPYALAQRICLLDC